MSGENRKSTKLFKKVVLATIAGITLLFTGYLDNGVESAELEYKQGNDPAPKEYLFASGMYLPSELREKVFFFNKNRANFTSFEGIKDIAVHENKLLFTIEKDSASLGWGNCRDKQPIEDIVSTFQKINIPVIRIRQIDGGESQWSAGFWRDGSRIPGEQSLTLTPSEWQELTFDQIFCPGANPDGLELNVSCKPGAKFEIEWLKLRQTIHAGYVRSEFTIPEGKIWRAVANIIASNNRDVVGQGTGRYVNGIDRIACQFYLNGQLVKRRGAKSVDHLDPVDIAAYLHPGNNCLGFYGFRIFQSPLLYIQGRIIMESGEIIDLKSGPDWNYSREEKVGWNQPGFDDQAWKKVLPGPLPPIQKRRIEEYNRQVGIPAYSGYLAIKNPTRKDLFYNDQDNVIVEVEVPSGLVDRQPVLVYHFGKADAVGSSHLLKQDSVPSFVNENGSLTYQIDLGRQTRGVYTLELTLRDNNNQVIAFRPREPLMVLRKMTSVAIAGKDYREGLDLELEDTIDFTNPDDPHPSVEGIMPVPMLNTVAERVKTPRIITAGNLRYREVTSPRRGSGFSYRIEFKHPGSFYYFELEYPDNAKRIIELIISSKTLATEKYGVWCNSQCGVGAETGGRMMLSNKMLTLKWLHIADSGPHSIDIINCMAGERAAAKSLKIYRVKGDLPAIASGAQRNFGIMTERCFPTSGIGMNFGYGISNSERLIREADKGRSMMEIYVRNLVWIEQACNNYLQYLKFSGQNLHVFGCYQYNETYAPFIPSPLLTDSRVLMCMKTILANVCDLNGIDFYAGVQFSQARETQSYANNAQVAQGADTINSVDNQGQQRYTYNLYSLMSNWMHPRQRDKFMETISSLSDTFSHLPHFRGVHNLISPDRVSGYWGPGFGVWGKYEEPMNASFDDVTMSLFESDTGIKLPANKDPKRFTKRAEFLSQPEMKPRFLAWRGEKFTELLIDGLKILRKNRSDLDLVNNLTLCDRKFYQHLKKSGQTLTTKLKEFAIDLDLIKQVDGLWVTRWTVSWRHWYPRPPHRNPYFWMARTNPDYIAAFDRDRYRSVFIRTSWDENFFFPGGYMLEKERGKNEFLMESDWIVNAEKTRALPQPAGNFAREAYIQAIITADPELIIGGWTDININVGHEQVLRDIIQPFTYLPKEKFTPVLNTWLDTNFAIRLLKQEKESYFYVANPGYWDIEGSVTLKTPGKVYEIPSGKPVLLEATEVENQWVLPLNIPPFGLSAYRVDSSQLEITDYDTKPIAQIAIAHMDKIIARVSQLLYDPKISVVLRKDEHSYMGKNLKEAQKAITEGEYARAWYLATLPDFWILGEDFLEKASDNLAILPGKFTKQAPREDPEKLPILKVRQNNQPIRIDGDLSDPLWTEGAYASDFWIITRKKTSMKETGVQAAYDEKNLYFAFVCAESHPEELKAEAKGEREIFSSEDDVLSFFIQPDKADPPYYYQFAVNSAGILFDQRIEGKNRDLDFHPPWKAAVKVEKDYWSIEVVIPLSALDIEAPPEAMKANFHRIVRNKMVEKSSWSYLPQGYPYLPHRLGYLSFEK